MSHLTICLIICVLTMISYVVGKFPIGLTAMLSMVAFVITGCLDPNTALSYFGNANGVMMLSMFVVAAGFNRTQFVKKCASSVNKIAKGSLTRVMFGYSTLPLGSGATQFAELNGYLEANDYTTYLVGLTDPMKARLPMLIVLALYCIFLAPKFAPDEPVVGMSGVESRADKRAALSPFKEKAGYIIFILTTLALIFQPQLKVPIWVICITGALAMIAFGVLTEKEAIGSINWPMAFLFVGALAMGGALTETGAGEVVGGILADFANKLSNPYLIGFVFFIVPFLLTQVMMNRTVMIIFIPIAILACKAMGANPVGVIILVQVACLSSFMTPMATPAVPMCMASGGYDIKSLMKQSLVPALVLCLVSVFWIMTVFPIYP